MNLLPASDQTWMHRARAILGRLVIAGAVVGAGAGVGHAVATSPSWRLSEVRFSGAAHATDGELRQLSDLHTGAHLLTVDLDRAIAGVERHPWVATATARRVYPGVVEIAVVEHQPVLMLALDRLWYVDADGTPFTTATSDDLDHPVLTGLDPRLAAAEPELGRAAIQGALRVLSAWSARGSDGGLREVSEVFYSPAHGFELVLRSGTRLQLGFGEPAEPLARLERLLEAGLSLSVPQSIDLDMKTVAVATPLPARPGEKPAPLVDPNAPPSVPDLPASDSPSLLLPTVPGPQGGSQLGGTSHD